MLIVPLVRQLCEFSSAVDLSGSHRMMHCEVAQVHR